jgi:nicotinamide mononucleotide transporter
MSPTEVVAVVFSFVCVFLTVRKRTAAWPVGLVGVSAYFVVFYQARLYADMALQVGFFVQGVYGWYAWAAEGTQEEDPTDIRVLSWRDRAALVALLALSTLAIGAGLARWTDAALPFLDSLLASMSLLANLLLARKVLENWVLWIIADVLYVGMFASRGLWLSSGLYVAFLVLATLGLIRWQSRRAGIAALS